MRIRDPECLDPESGMEKFVPRLTHTLNIIHYQNTTSFPANIEDITWVADPDPCQFGKKVIKSYSKTFSFDSFFIT
jgi:hypothetical protein